MRGQQKVSNKRLSAERKKYMPPTATFQGEVNSITKGITCSLAGHKFNNMEQDDVTPMGFYGTPMCDEDK